MSDAQTDGQLRPELRAQVLDAMRAVFGDDRGRIAHTMTVLGHAEQLRAREGGREDVTVLAAILHDIGIPAAVEKYGSADWKHQEVEGPPIAREILQRTDADTETIDHVCRIVANHHSARDIDTPEFRAVWDADWLVNLERMITDWDPVERRTRIEKIFKTDAGRKLAANLYLNEGDTPR